MLLAATGVQCSNASLSHAPKIVGVTSIAAANMALKGWDQQLNCVAGGVPAARQATPSMPTTRQVVRVDLA